MTPNGFILIVEDDPVLLSSFLDTLQTGGHRAEAACDADTAIAEVKRMPVSLLIVDTALANGNPYSVIAAAKDRHDAPLPVLLVGSRDEFYSVAGLASEIDAYLAKPFPKDALLRVVDALAHAPQKSPSVFTVRNLRFDCDLGIATKDGEQIFLSPLEARLLTVLFKNRGSILSRHRLVEESWDASGGICNIDTIADAIDHLREKIEDDADKPCIIRTARGLGYLIEA